MTLTILFFHGGELIRLTVVYAPSLDEAKQEGMWDTANNRVALSWRLFKEFKNERDNGKRKKLLESIPRDLKKGMKEIA
ncbi:MAG: hypothetical protein IPO83_02465 [Chitinophagaceae bacterium]|nr:hypothetical protein [Chitinophagaceae bacterium]